MPYSRCAFSKTQTVLLTVDADANGVFSGKEAVTWCAIPYPIVKCHTIAYHSVPYRTIHILQLVLAPLLCGSSLALIAANEEVLISIVIANITPNGFILIDAMILFT